MKACREVLEEQLCLLWSCTVSEMAEELPKALDAAGYVIVPKTVGDDMLRVAAEAQLRQLLSTPSPEPSKDVAGEDWPPLKMALWRVLMDERLNEGHYIKAFELVEKLHGAALSQSQRRKG